MQDVEPGNEIRVESTKGFWARQFQTETTRRQRIFDWAFGVVIPAACCYFDPIVFKGGVFGIATFASYKPFAYTLSFVSIMAMTAFLLWGARLQWLNALFAGLFLVGSAVAFGFGIMLAPLSLIGLLFLIGALGFTPLLSGIVYARNARRAFVAARSCLSKGVLIRASVLGVIFSAIVPLAMNWEVQKSIDEINNGSESEMHFAAKKLTVLAPLVNFDQLALHYHLRDSKQEGATERRMFIAEFYERMTGIDVEDSKYRLVD
jgi:hypothetical protein